MIQKSKVAMLPKFSGKNLHVWAWRSSSKMYHYHRKTNIQKRCNEWISYLYIYLVKINKTWSTIPSKTLHTDRRNWQTALGMGNRYRNTKMYKLIYKKSIYIFDILNRGISIYKFILGSCLMLLDTPYMFLEEFKIDKNKIVAITTDGSANIKAAAWLFLGNYRRIPCMTHCINLNADEVLGANTSFSDRCDQLKSIVVYLKQSVNTIDQLWSEQEASRKTSWH